MAADDLDAPLGKAAAKKKRYSIPPAAVKALPFAALGALGLFLGAFAVWALVGDDPLGGEPIAVASIDKPASEGKKDEPAGEKSASGSRRYDGPEPGAAPAAPAQAPNTKTITIIDGSSGKTQDVLIPAPGGAAAEKRASVEPKLLETSRHGAIPKIAADGTRPSDVYAQPLRAQAANPDGPRIALIVGGLGVSANASADAMKKLAGPVTFGFTPYGGDLENLVARARGEGHEVLLQVPMEPFDYPDNDPGPQTLLTSLSADQNVDRLQWLLSRFQGYVGIGNYMGARFTAAESALAPVLRETAKRGLIYVDDGSSPRSVAAQIAGANKIAFVKADVVIDSVPTGAEIERALGRLEAIARERGQAVGVASALPVAVDRIAKWAKGAPARGITLVPISAVVNKPKSS